MSKSETLRSLTAKISKTIESFAQNEQEVKKALNNLASSDPGAFFAAGIRVVAASKPSSGLRYLILTMAKDRRFSIGLLDTNVCSLEEAVAVTRAAAEAGAQLQATFEMALNKALQGQANPQKAERIGRILDVLAVTCDQNCWNSFQVELMAYPDKIVRAKAALLIGRSTRNVAWIARRLLDRDPRVQASAVEALWGLDAGETKQHFLSALKSSHNRVAANAAYGLYLSGDSSAAQVLLDLLRHKDPAFQLSALWAIGETRDERFLAALNEYYKQVQGKRRLAAVGAMARIRHRDRAAHEAGELQLHLAQAALQPDGVRRLSFALSCHPARDLNSVMRAEFAVWENGAMVDDYQVRSANPPAALIAGFLAPWFASDDQPYENALREGLRQCLSMKRRDDLWRIDRYSIEINPQSGEKAREPFPYDHTLVTADLKAAHGCISDPDLLTKAFGLPAPLERAADPVTAFERECDAFSKHGGKRHAFLFLHEMSGADLREQAGIERLRKLAQDGSVVLHGVCPDVAGQWPLVRQACLSTPDGSFADTTLEGMVDALVDAYANLSSRFELVYSLASPAPAPHDAIPGTSHAPTVKLKISSDHGYGEAEFALELPPPAPPPVAAAPAPAAPAEEQSAKPQQAPQPV
jgi:hypothetical protein